LFLNGYYQASIYVKIQIQNCIEYDMMVCDHPASASFEAMISRKLKDNEVKIRMHYIIESEENTEMGGNHQELLEGISLYKRSVL